MEGKPSHFLVRGGLISAEQLEEAREYGKRWGWSVYCALVRLEIVDEEELVQFLARSLKLPLIDLEKNIPPREIMGLIPLELARKHTCLPIQRDETGLTIATMDPLNILVFDEIKLHTGLPAKIAIARHREISAVLSSL